MRRAKSLRIGVHHANAVVWGPVYRTRLELFAERRLAVAAAAAAAVAVVAVVAVVVCGEADLVYALVVRCRSHQIIKNGKISSVTTTVITSAPRRAETSTRAKTKTKTVEENGFPRLRPLRARRREPRRKRRDDLAR